MKRHVALLIIIVPLLVRPTHSAEMLFLMGKDAAGNKIVPTNTITIPTNEVLLFNGVPEIFGMQVSGSPLASHFFGYVFVKDSFRIQGTFDRSRSFPGPGELSFVLNLCDSCGTPSFSTLNTNSGAFIRLTSSLQNYPPDKSIIIPAGSPGGRISLEMSSDLLAWSPAPLGSYTSPTNHLFFRLKVERVE
jgi:hypothetical protein